MKRLNICDLEKIIDKLARHVQLKGKYSDFPKVYLINDSALDAETKTVFSDIGDAVSERLTSEMRHSDTESAIQACRDVVEFSNAMLASGAPDKIKIALTGHWNTIGFMFDRNKKSYLGCNAHLKNMLDAIEAYKKKLSPEDLSIWNNSTYGGSDQVPFFRGYLQGVRAH